MPDDHLIKALENGKKSMRVPGRYRVGLGVGLNLKTYFLEMVTLNFFQKSMTFAKVFGF